MPVVYVTSNDAGAGKTGVAAAIARHYAYQGVPTTLVRFEGGDADGNAPLDARFFANLFFVPGSPAEPVAATAYGQPGGDALAVIEGDPASAPEGASVVWVSRQELVEPAADSPAPVALVVTDLPPYAPLAPRGEDVAPAFGIQADRCLAGFAVEDVLRALNAEVLVEGDPEMRAATCDYLVIAPIGSDAGQPYFRRFVRAAVVARYDKTDMHLAAVRAQPVCMVLTGGRRPSEYTFDAAGSAGIPVFLSRADTENTVLALEEVFDATRFAGEAKLNRMSELLESSGLFASLDSGIPAAAAQ